MAIKLTQFPGSSNGTSKIIPPKTYGGVQLTQFPSSVPKQESKVSQDTKSGYGASQISKDPYTGKPTITYSETIPKTFLSPEKTIQFQDVTRVAPSFDPTKAQPITRDVLKNGRLPESASQILRDKLGAGYNEQLDHQIALTLSGSNKNENLKLIPTEKNKQAGTKEAQLANDVISGKISLLDAQREDAKQKGIKLPEDINKPNTGILGSIKGFLLNTPSILEPLANIQDNFINSFKDIIHPRQFADKVLGEGYNAIKNSVDNLSQSIVNLSVSRTPSEAVGNTLKTVNSAVATFISPISALFSMAGKLPGITPVSDITNIGMESVSKLAQDSVKNVIDLVPNSVMDMRAKENISSGVGEVLNTIAQFGIFALIAPEGNKIKPIEEGFNRQGNKLIELKDAVPIKTKDVGTPIDLKNIKENITVGDLESLATKNGWNVKDNTAKAQTDFIKEVVTETANEISKNKSVTPERANEIVNNAKDKIVNTVRNEIRGITETPKGTPSKIGKSIEAKAIEDKLTKGFDKTAEYSKINIKEEAKKVSDLINSDIDRARSIVRGEEPLPDNIQNTQSIVNGIEEYLKKNPDPNLAYELANSPLVSATSKYAQELRLTAERTPDSATAKIVELRKIREEKAMKSTNMTKSDVVKQLKNETSKINIPKEELNWNKFIDSITC